MSPGFGEASFASTQVPIFLKVVAPATVETVLGTFTPT